MDSDDVSDELDDVTDDGIDQARSSVPADRYKRRVESRPTRSDGEGGNKGLLLLAAALVVLGAVALLLIQPWNSTPLEVTGVQNERVELVELIGANGCFWRFDVEVANQSDDRAWITSVEIFLDDELRRPEVSTGFVQPDVRTSVPLEFFLGEASATGQCPAVSAIDHGPVKVLHASTDEVFEASTSF